MDGRPDTPRPRVRHPTPGAAADHAYHRPVFRFSAASQAAVVPPREVEVKPTPQPQSTPMIDFEKTMASVNRDLDGLKTQSFLVRRVSAW